MESDERMRLQSRLAIAAPDLLQMSMAADSDLCADMARFYPMELPDTPDTAGTIEKFLNTYGKPDRAEEAMLEKLIFNPTPDYAQMLAREEEKSVPAKTEAPAGSQDDLINSFIIKSKAAGGQFPATVESEKPEPPAAPAAPVQKPEAPDSTMLSESLARAYIRRGQYAKAHEIISNLNLNFPEKSIYFADQLRFLGKLLAIEERKRMLNQKN